MSFDEVAQVQLVEQGPVLSERSLAGHDLKLAGVVFEIEEGDPAHVAQRRDASGDDDCGTVAFVRHPLVGLETGAGLGEGVAALSSWRVGVVSLVA